MKVPTYYVNERSFSVVPFLTYFELKSLISNVVRIGISNDKLYRWAIVCPCHARKTLSTVFCTERFALATVMEIVENIWCLKTLLRPGNKFLQIWSFDSALGRECHIQPELTDYTNFKLWMSSLLSSSLKFSKFQRSSTFPTISFYFSALRDNGYKIFFFFFTNWSQVHGPRTSRAPFHRSCLS